MYVRGFRVTMRRNDLWEVFVNPDEAGDMTTDEILFAAKEKIDNVVWHGGAGPSHEVEWTPECVTFLDIETVVPDGA